MVGFTDSSGKMKISYKSRFDKLPFVFIISFGNSWPAIKHKVVETHALKNKISNWKKIVT
jgi:hypothetical protein